MYVGKIYSQIPLLGKICTCVVYEQNAHHVRMYYIISFGHAMQQVHYNCAISDNCHALAVMCYT